MQNLITLEKLRYGDRLDVDFNISGPVKEFKIPPLLMLPFLENAFKHGGLNNRDLKIKINCKVIDNKTLDFEILNNFVISQNHNPKRGIGLVNTKKRLKLIYRNNFSLKQKTKLNFYIIR